jgi:hypothetical protein
LRRVVRCASPLVAQRVCARVAASGRGGQRAREQVLRSGVVVAPRWREVAVAPCRVSSADHDFDDRGRGHDDDRTSHNDDDCTTAHDDHDHSAAAATTDHHHHDDRTTAAGADEQ